MAEIGELNKLKVVRKLDFGVYLDGGNLGEILLPRDYLPENCLVNDFIEVFIFFDSKDRIIATTDKPYAMVNEFAYLKVKSVTDVGAFLDWGLNKDLFVPFREQKKGMVAGKSYIVYIYLDTKSNRLAASERLDRFMDKGDVDYEEGELVKLLICFKTDLGYKAIINGSNWGVLYHNEIFGSVKIGQRLNGYIKKVREDNKIDLTLQKPGIEKVVDVYEKIIQKLIDSGGYLAVTDKTEAELIYELFGVSKKTYKKAVGALYKRRLITIEENGIKLIVTKE